MNRFSNELVEMDVLYAINAKKEPAALLPLFTDKTALGTDSTITIAKLLEYVNQYFPDILPEDVLKHFGHDARPAGKLGKDALFQERDTGAAETKPRRQRDAAKDKARSVSKDLRTMEKEFLRLCVCFRTKSLPPGGRCQRS